MSPITHTLLDHRETATPLMLLFLTECGYVDVESPPRSIEKSKKKVRKRDKFDAYMERKRLFECFWCYNEIWGVIMGIVFLDGPFLIARLIIMIRYRAISQTIIYWTVKNAFVILLRLNQIRLIYKTQKEPWQKRMNQVNQQRHSNR